MRRVPRKRHIRGTVIHRWLGDHIFLPALWRFERKSVAAGVGLGLFWAMMPIPFQMVPAGISAFFARVNMPAAMASVWVTNPITWPLILYWQYRLGVAILGVGGGAGVQGPGAGMGTVSLLLGCLITGVAAGAAGCAGGYFLWPGRGGKVATVGDGAAGKKS